MQKKLERGSRFEQHDLDGDGIVTDEEIAREERMIKLENADKMQDQQRLICWVSVISSGVSVALVVSPLVGDQRVPMVTALLSTYVVANMGIVAAFMGATAFTRVKENGQGT
tara:strand:+ start:317 stop:652 length:336 start_codon:yes stop_codon:yes gene_type:complete